MLRDSPLSQSSVVAFSHRSHLLHFSSDTSMSNDEVRCTFSTERLQCLTNDSTRSTIDRSVHIGIAMKGLLEMFQINPVIARSNESNLRSDETICDCKQTILPNPTDVCSSSVSNLPELSYSMHQSDHSLYCWMSIFLRIRKSTCFLQTFFSPLFMLILR